MDQETRSKWAIWGSLIAMIGFFLPWETISIPGVNTISVNGPSWHIQAVWGIFVTSIVVLVIGLATSEGANEFVNILQKFLHFGQSAGFLFSFFSAMNDGSLTRAAQTGVFSSTGYSPQGYYMALGTHVNFGIGFWAMVLGFVVSGIGIYAKES